MISLEQLINYEETLVYMDGDIAYTWDGGTIFRAYVAQGYHESWELSITTSNPKSHTLASAKDYAQIWHSDRFFD